MYHSSTTTHRFSQLVILICAVIFALTCLTCGGEKKLVVATGDYTIGVDENGDPLGPVLINILASEPIPVFDTTEGWVPNEDNNANEGEAGIEMKDRAFRMTCTPKPFFREKVTYSKELAEPIDIKRYTHVTLRYRAQKDTTFSCKVVVDNRVVPIVVYEDGKDDWVTVTAEISGASLTKVIASLDEGRDIQQPSRPTNVCDIAFMRVEERATTLDESANEFNFLVNGSFEDYDTNTMLPAGHNLPMKMRAGSKAKTMIVTDDRKHGRAALKTVMIKRPVANNPWIGWEMRGFAGNLKPDTRYIFRVWVKTLDTKWGPKFLLRRLSPYTEFRVFHPQATDGVWKLYEYKFELDDTVDFDKLSFAIGMREEGTYFIDQMKIIEEPQEKLPVGNILANGSAEAGLDGWRGEVKSRAFGVVHAFNQLSPELTTDAAVGTYAIRRPFKYGPEGVRAFLQHELFTGVGGKKAFISFWSKIEGLPEGETEHELVVWMTGYVKRVGGWGSPFYRQNKVTITPEWKQYHIPIVMPETDKSYLFSFQLEGWKFSDEHSYGWENKDGKVFDPSTYPEDREGAYYIDGVQITYDEEPPTEYTERDGLALSFHYADGMPKDNVYFFDDDVTPKVMLRTVVTGKAKTFMTDVRDWEGNLLMKQEMTFEPGTHDHEIELPKPAKGHFTFNIYKDAKKGEVLWEWMYMVAPTRPKVEYAENSHFGAHGRVNDFGFNFLQKIGVKWVRDFYTLQWENVQYRKDMWDDETYQRALAVYDTYKLKGEFVLHTTPIWASTAPEDTQPYYKKRGWVPKMEYWREYIKRVVTETHEHSAAGAYELMNEPDIPGHLNTSEHKDYFDGWVELVKAGYKEAKAVDEDIDVVAQAVAFLHRDTSHKWLDKVYEKDVMKYMDVFSFHAYEQRIPSAFEPAFPERIKQWKEEAASLEKDMRYWMDEGIVARYRPVRKSTVACWDDGRDSMQALRIVIHSTIEYMAFGVDKSFQYLGAYHEPYGDNVVIGGNFTTFQEDQQYPKPTAAAYAQMTHMLEGATFASSGTAGTCLYYIFKNKGTQIACVWNTKTGNVTETLPFAGKQALDTMGNEIDATFEGGKTKMLVSPNVRYIILQ